MRFAFVLALAVLVPFMPSRAYAADANLDPTFGTFGRTVVDVLPGGTDWAQDVLVQADGAIVAAGLAGDEDQTGANDGFTLGILQAPPSRPAKVVLKAKGANVAPPTPALATPVTAQLLGTNDQCYGATFATPSVNAGGRFRASGQ